MEMKSSTLLTRDALARELKCASFPLSSKTLANLAHQGKGPPYQAFSRRALYRWGDALAWARSRLSEPQGSIPKHTTGV